MSIDLMIGFHEKPLDLHERIRSEGFELREDESNQASADSPITIRSYRYFVDGVSSRGVWLYYHDELAEDEHDLWSSLSPQRAVVATASIVTYMSRNGFDEMVQYSTAMSIRNKYNGLMFDPQDGILQ